MWTPQKLLHLKWRVLADVSILYHCDTPHQSQSGWILGCNAQDILDLYALWVPHSWNSWQWRVCLDRGSSSIPPNQSNIEFGHSFGTCRFVWMEYTFSEIEDLFGSSFFAIWAHSCYHVYPHGATHHAVYEWFSPEERLEALPSKRNHEWYKVAHESIATQVWKLLPSCRGCEFLQ